MIGDVLILILVVAMLIAVIRCHGKKGGGGIIVNGKPTVDRPTKPPKGQGVK